MHYLHAESEPPYTGCWERVDEHRHEYLAWRMYDDRRVYALCQLPSKKLRDVCAFETRRGPQVLSLPKKKSRPEAADVPTGPLQHDEMRAACLPRKHLVPFLEAHAFGRVASGALVRCSQLVNGTRTFYAGYVLGVKRLPRSYRIRISKDNEKVTDVALQVGTKTGNRLVGLDALSNEQPTDEELGRFRFPVDPVRVREKIRSLQRAMQDHAELFEEEELRARAEQEARLREKLEEEERLRRVEEEARERKEREREEMRRRAAAHKPDTEAWWLKYGAASSAGDKQREIGKLKARLQRFNKIASTSTAEGERENAERLAKQAAAKLETLQAAEQAAEAE